VRTLSQALYLDSFVCRRIIIAANLTQHALEKFLARRFSRGSANMLTFERFEANNVPRDGEDTKHSRLWASAHETLASSNVR
jgi:hypothetical protein